EPWVIETSLVPVPWKRVTPTKDMTVGIMWDDGCVCWFFTTRWTTDLSSNQMRPSPSTRNQGIEICQREALRSRNQNRRLGALQTRPRLGDSGTFLFNRQTKQ